MWRAFIGVVVRAQPVSIAAARIAEEVVVRRLLLRGRAVEIILEQRLRSLRKSHQPRADVGVVFRPVQQHRPGCDRQGRHVIAEPVGADAGQREVVVEPLHDGCQLACERRSRRVEHRSGIGDDERGEARVKRRVDSVTGHEVIRDIQNRPRRYAVELDAGTDGNGVRVVRKIHDALVRRGHLFGAENDPHRGASRDISAVIDHRISIGQCDIRRLVLGNVGGFGVGGLDRSGSADLRCQRGKIRHRETVLPLVVGHRQIPCLSAHGHISEANDPADLDRAVAERFIPDEAAEFCAHRRLLVRIPLVFRNGIDIHRQRLRIFFHLHHRSKTQIRCACLPEDKPVVRGGVSIIEGVRSLNAPLGVVDGQRHIRRHGAEGDDVLVAIGDGDCTDEGTARADGEIELFRAVRRAAQHEVAGKRSAWRNRRGPGCLCMRREQLRGERENEDERCLDGEFHDGAKNGDERDHLNGDPVFSEGKTRSLLARHRGAHLRLNPEWRVIDRQFDSSC